MKKSTFTFLLCTVLLAACSNDKKNSGNEKSDVFKEIYSADNIKAQLFNIDNSSDNTITGQSGTKVFIPKDCFVEGSGKTVSGNIQIELKEALHPIDWVMGNLTTIYDGKPLESGGMIYLDAKAQGKGLAINSNKSIKVEVPTENFLDNMSLFKGTITKNGVKWSDPVMIPGQTKTEDVAEIETLKRNKTTNVRYSVEGFIDASDAPQEVHDEVGRICWSGNGLKITKDSTLKIEGHVVHFYKNTDLVNTEEIKIQKGVNTFVEDDATSYIFSIKKLGWANIDRLMEDPRTEEVNLITSISNNTDFKLVYVSLITQKMYLPGYQKKDGTYCFSHDDNETQMLPLGETATILATAYKDGKPYFALQQIKIKKDQTIAFDLKETTKNNLKEKLLKAL